MVQAFPTRVDHADVRIPSKEYLYTDSAGYFPFVYAIMMTLFGAGLLPNIVGIVLGHCYIFVKDIAVVRYHKDYFQTPLWFNRWWYGAGQ